jgi:hypothetical protein
MNINAFFDAIGKASEIAGIAGQARSKREQIESVTSRRCGNCEHWMKTTCKPEKVHKQFKSSGSIACGAFQRDWMSLKLETEFRVELDEINGRLAPLLGAGQRTGADQ